MTEGLESRPPRRRNAGGTAARRALLPDHGTAAQETADTGSKLMITVPDREV